MPSTDMMSSDSKLMLEMIFDTEKHIFNGPETSYLGENTITFYTT